MYPLQAASCVRGDGVSGVGTGREQVPSEVSKERSWAGLGTGGQKHCSQCPLHHPTWKWVGMKGSRGQRQESHLVWKEVWASEKGEGGARSFNKGVSLGLN